MRRTSQQVPQARDNKDRMRRAQNWLRRSKIAEKIVSRLCLMKMKPPLIADTWGAIAYPRVNEGPDAGMR